MKRFKTTNLQNVIGKQCEKFLVNTFDILEELKTSEVNLYELCKIYKIKISKDLKDSKKTDIFLDVNKELSKLLINKGIFKEVMTDNTENYSGKINHNIKFTIYYNKKDRMYYVDLSVNLGNSTNNNYSNSVIYKFGKEKEIYDTFNSEAFCRFNKIKFKNIEYKIKSCCLDENIHIFGGKTKILDIFDTKSINEDEIKKEIKNYVDNRNNNIEIGKKIEIFDMEDDEKFKKMDYDKKYYNMEYYNISKICRYDLILESVDNTTIKIRIKKMDLFKIY